MTKIERGAVTRTAGAYDGMFVGSSTISGVAGTPVHAQQMPVLEVLLQNDPSSDNNILVGNQFGQYFVLRAGESVNVPINDLNDVYVSCPAGAATLNWIAMT